LADGKQVSQRLRGIALLEVIDSLAVQRVQVSLGRLLDRLLLQFHEIGHEVWRDSVETEEEMEPSHPGVQLSLLDPDQGRRGEPLPTLGQLLRDLPERHPQFFSTVFQETADGNRRLQCCATHGSLLFQCLPFDTLFFRSMADCTILSVSSRVNLGAEP
jgi:hypothetical protein